MHYTYEEALKAKKNSDSLINNMLGFKLLQIWLYDLYKIIIDIYFVFTLFIFYKWFNRPVINRPVFPANWNITKIDHFMTSFYKKNIHQNMPCKNHF